MNHKARAKGSKSAYIYIYILNLICAGVQSDFLQFPTYISVLFSKGLLTPIFFINRLFSVKKGTQAKVRE